jgi:iron complex outermembrane receptor protein
MMNSRLPKLALLAGAAFLFASTATLAQPAAASGFTIPPQDLGGALIKLAQTSGRNILFAPGLVSGRTSGSVANAPDFDSALHQVLSGSGMAYRIAADGSVTIQRGGARPLPSARPTRTVSEAADPEPAKGDAVAEVIVTARKRPERLQDVPISMTVISGAGFNDAGHIGVLSFNQLAPSLNMVISTPHQTSLAIRGIGTNPASDGLEQSTGIFVDGVYLGRPGMAVFDLIDIDHIEVLRGPQGTLFGKNTTAGAITITTTPPSFQPSAAAQMTVGNYNYNQFQGYVSGPITDTLAGRFSVYRTTRDGLITDTTTGGKTNAIDRDGLRGQLLFRPTDAFDLRVIGGFDEENDSNANSVYTNAGATPAALEQKLGLVGASLAFSPDGTLTAANDPTHVHMRQASLSAEANWRVDGLTLTSLTAWRKWSFVASSDVDVSRAAILDGAYDNHDQQFSQEFRVATPSGHQFEGVAGAYFFYQRLMMDQDTFYGPDAPVYLSGSNPALPSLLPYANTRWDVLADPTTYSYALFGQGTWHVNDRLEVTAGLRGTYETKRETVSRPNPTSTLTDQPVAALASVVFPAASVGTADFEPSGLLSVSYHLSPSVTTYALVSHGAKSGGVNSTLPATGLSVDSLKVKPETATSAEAGFKTQFFEDRLTVNGDVFFTRFDDYQAAFISPIPGKTSAFTTLLTNAGAAQTRGFELEATATPISNLRLNTFVDLNDATYASYTNAPCPAEVIGKTSCNLTGRPVAGAPPWSVGANGEYGFDLLPGLRGFVGGEYLWKSQYYGYLDDSRFSIIPEHSVADARIGVRDANGHWTATLWVKNLTDGHYAANILNSSGILPGTYAYFFADPRTYGLTVRADF